ncbi:MAG TPA: MarR family winged helix-turn-helix transcriptional regulator [Burkholderiaceae bacterium]|nr:MarR family winged helix-turn-helix transcriptional regulator [Burkholderiaceae bacterium]
MPARRKAASTPPEPDFEAPANVDLERYVPAYLSWISNKLSRGASQHYLSEFNIGIEVWRCLVLLAVESEVSAQQVSRVIGMDKAAVSRCFKSMNDQGYITFGLDAMDGRVRLARLTPKGRTLHDDVLQVALARERAFLSVLSDAEVNTLIELLKRLHENLPQVDAATVEFLAQRNARAAKSSRKRT